MAFVCPPNKPAHFGFESSALRCVGDQPGEIDCIAATAAAPTATPAFAGATGLLVQLVLHVE